MKKFAIDDLTVIDIVPNGPSNDGESGIITVMKKQMGFHKGLLIHNYVFVQTTIFHTYTYSNLFFSHAYVHLKSAILNIQSIPVTQEK